MNHKIEWIDGAPEKLEVGMLVELDSGSILLVGDIDDYYSRCDYSSDPLPEFTRWSWLIKPHELEWIEDMAKRSRKDA